MTDKERLHFARDLLDIQRSLHDAVTEAGGIINSEYLQNMTVLELMCTLASNNIRFVYKEPK